MTVAKWTRSWFIVSDSMHSSAFGNEKRHTIYLTKRTGDKMATVARPDLHCGPCLSHNAHTLYIRMYIHKLGYRARCQSIILYVALTNIHGYRTLRPQDTSASRHSGTLRHRSQDTSTPKTWYKILRHECRDQGKAGTLRPRTIPMRRSSTVDSS